MSSSHAASAWPASSRLYEDACDRPTSTLTWVYREHAFYPSPPRNYQKARPIIAYCGTWSARPAILLAHAVYQLMTSAFGPNDSFNIDSTVLAMQQVWQYLQDDLEWTSPKTMYQQDLAGFFNSVPHNVILQSIDMLMVLLRDQGRHIAEDAVQVNIEHTRKPHLRRFN